MPGITHLTTRPTLTNRCIPGQRPERAPRPEPLQGAGCPDAPTLRVRAVSSWGEQMSDMTAKGPCVNSTLARMAFSVRPRTGPGASDPSPVVTPTDGPGRTAKTWTEPPASRSQSSDRNPNGTGRSVLICDDRPAVRQELSEALRSDSLDSIREVSDGAALLDAYEVGPIFQVLVAVHSGSEVGRMAIDLLLATHPDAAPIVIGSLADIDLLAAAYARGAGGLVLWEPRSAGPETG